MAAPVVGLERGYRRPLGADPPASSTCCWIGLTDSCLSLRLWLASLVAVRAFAQVHGTGLGF